MSEDQGRGYIIIPAEESDAPAIMKLFEINYPKGYPDSYDEKRIRYEIYSDSPRWWKGVPSIEEKETVLGAGAITLDYGDYNDQLGLIGKLVTSPGRKGSNIALTLGRDIVEKLVSEAEDNLECVIGFARTFRRVSQRHVARAGLKSVGYLPHYKIMDGRRESLVLYAKLCGEGPNLRSERPPQVVPEVEELARRAISAMGLPPALEVVNDCAPYSGEFDGGWPDVDTHSLAQLRQIDRGQSNDPVMFDNVSLDYGMPVLARKQVNYLMAADGQRPLGAIGYRFDKVNASFKITELIFSSADVIDHLCARAIDKAKQEGAKIIEVDLSAYDARIQQTFLGYGFHPVAYIPAMVFHNTYRLDIVKMLKLEIPYDPSETEIIREAEQVVSLVVEKFNGAHAQST